MLWFCLFLELHQEGSATNGATPSSFMCSVQYRDLSVELYWDYSALLYTENNANWYSTIQCTPVHGVQSTRLQTHTVHSCKVHYSAQYSNAHVQ